MENCNNEYLLIKPELTDIDGITKAFKDWFATITYCNGFIILPDGAEISCLPWLNNQNVFDNGSFTHFLLDYYNDNVK